MEGASGVFASLGTVSDVLPVEMNILNNSANPVKFYGREGGSNFKVDFGASAGAFAISLPCRSCVRFYPLDPPPRFAADG